jgi:hypothetical protein
MTTPRSPMRRILIAEYKQEVSTFNPHRSTCDDFAIRRGADLLRYHRSIRNEVGGALSVFDQASDIGGNLRGQDSLGRKSKGAGLIDCRQCLW